MSSGCLDDLQVLKASENKRDHRLLHELETLLNGGRVSWGFLVWAGGSVGLFCDHSPDSRSTLDAMPSSWTRSLVNRVTLPLQQQPSKPHCVDANGPAII